MLSTYANKRLFLWISTCVSNFAKIDGWKVSIVEFSFWSNGTKFFCKNSEKLFYADLEANAFLKDATEAKKVEKIDPEKTHLYFAVYETKWGKTKSTVDMEEGNYIATRYAKILYKGAERIVLHMFPAREEWEQCGDPIDVCGYFLDLEAKTLVLEERNEPLRCKIGKTKTPVKKKDRVVYIC